MLPWCGTAGLSVFRGEEGPGAGETFGSIWITCVQDIFRGIWITKSLSAALGRHGTLSRHVRKSFSFSFFEKKLFFYFYFFKIDDPKLQPAVKATACKCYRENKSGKQFLLQRM